MKELISVIVPIYNVEQYVTRCVYSICKQTYSNLEIILVDDGSTDGSGLLCEQLAKEDKRIRVIHQKNEGLSAARNSGIEIAKGQFYAFVDSDDYVHERFVELLYMALSETGATISECMYQRFHQMAMLKREEKEVPKVYSNTEMLQLLTGKHYEKHIVAWNKLYRKEVFDVLRYPVGRLHEDEFTTYKCFFSAQKVAIISNELYYYFFNNDSITTKKIRINRLDAIDAVIERFDFYKSKNYNELCDKTGEQLLQLIADFQQKKVYEFENYNEFQKAMKAKYVSCIEVFRQCKMKNSSRIWSLIGKYRVDVFRHYNQWNYYMTRLKEKLHGLYQKISSRVKA